MSHLDDDVRQSDAAILFVITGALTCKNIFSPLYGKIANFQCIHHPH